MKDCEYSLGNGNADPCGECDACCAAFDKWEAEAPAREQRARERLDAEGYYDDPEAWMARMYNDAKGG